MGHKKDARWCTLHSAGILAFFLGVAVLLQHALVPVSQWTTTTLHHDAIFQTYLLAWGSHALAPIPLDFYNPPIFYPELNIVESTDALELPALLLWPLWALTHNPYLLANSLGVISHLFALAASYLVVRKQFALNRSLAILIALLFTVTSDRLWHAAGHFNLVWSGLIPVTWYAAWLLLHQPRRRYNVLLAFALGLSIYFSVYFFVLCALCVAATVAGWMLANRSILSRHKFALFLSSVAAALIIAIPKIILYSWASFGVKTVRNTLQEAGLYSADWRGYLLPTQPDSALAMLTHWGANHPTVGENNQFIGYVLCAILLCELGRIIYRYVSRTSTKSDAVSITAFATGLFLVLCSFGPRFHILGVSPYHMLYYSLFQFTGFFRVPARLAFVSQWFFLISACVFFSSLRLNTKKWGSLALLIVVGPIILFEHVPLIPASPLKQTDTSILSRIDQADPSQLQPYLNLTSEMDLAMAVANIPNWRPTVNGWKAAALGSRFDRRVLSFTTDFPSTGTIGWLASNNVPWVIVHGDTMKARLDTDGRLSHFASVDTMHLYHLRDIAQTKKQYDAYLKSSERQVQHLRRQTSQTLTLTGTSPLWITPNPAPPFNPSGPPPAQKTSGTPSAQGLQANSNAPPTYWHCLKSPGPFTPALYDRLTVTYKLHGPPTPHRAKIYWGNFADITATRMIKAKTRHAKDGSPYWQASFNLAKNYDWMTDPNAAWILIRFDRFKGAPPADVQITNLEFSRRSTAVQIPMIDQTSED